MKFKKAKKICRKAGLYVSKEGLAFTVAGGRLTSGAEAPEWLLKLNGCDAHEAARDILRQHMGQPFMPLAEDLIQDTADPKKAHAFLFFTQNGDAYICPDYHEATGEASEHGARLLYPLYAANPIVLDD